MFGNTNPEGFQNALTQLALVFIILISGCESEPISQGEMPPPPPEAVAEMRRREKAAMEGKDPFASIESADSLNSNEPEVELSAAKQDAIWKSEHITFEIETCFGPRFWAGLKSDVESALPELTLPAFSGCAATEVEKQGELSMGSVAFTRFKALGQQPALDATAFSQQLREKILPLSSHKSTKFRVLSISRLSAESGTGGSAENSEKQDSTAGASVESSQWKCRIYLASDGTNDRNELLHMTSEHDVVFQFGNETELKNGPVLLSWNLADLAIEFTRQPMFREVTDEVGLNNAGIDDNWELPIRRVQQYRFQMAVADFDLDGWLDIAVAENHLSRLFRWAPEFSRFVQVTELVGIAPLHVAKGKPVSLAGFFDFDNDGDTDLILGNRFYENVQGEKFTDITEKSGLRFQRQAMGVHFADFDCDGFVDIYILYQSSSDSAESTTRAAWINDDTDGEDNHLWRNLGNGRFRNVTEASKSGAGHRNTLAATWFFHDDDHFPDLYVANDFSQNSLLRNTGNRQFEDITEQSETGAFATSMGVVAGDVDNDGRSDLYVASMFSKMGRRIIGNVSETDYPEGVFQQIQGSCAGNQLYRRADSDTRYFEFGEATGIHDVGWAYAPAFADFDNDGLLDIYAGTGFLSFERNEPDG